MTTNDGPRQLRETPEHFDPLRAPLELRCEACGRKDRYQVGRLFIDPSLHSRGDPEGMDKSFCFTRYFHCTHCRAGGPWHLTPDSTRALTALLVEAMTSPRNARIHRAKITLFDGTTSRWPTSGEAYLKNLIEQDPDNYFLWNRLGNLYKCGEVPDLALPAFHEAVARNEHDVEAHHSIAEIHLEREDKETAARAFHEVLRHARHAPVKSPSELVRSLVEDALRTLAALHLESNKRIPLLPEAPISEQTAPESPLIVRGYDLSTEQGMSDLVDWWMTGKPAKPAKPAKPKQRPTPLLAPKSTAQRLGRNDPCPCGSGKKYKHCCLHG